MIKQKSGEVDILPYKKAASTVFSRNDVVTKDASGYLVRATATTPRSDVLGLIDRDVAATDDDYASNTLVNVTKVSGDEDKEFEMDVDTGTLTQAMVGKQFDLADHNGVDVTSNSVGHVECLRVISGTKGVFKFLTGGRNNAELVLKSHRQVVTIAEFTDGGGATGTLALGVTLPVGAVFVQSLVTEITGTTGETASATMTIGDGTDVDRYNTGTINVAANSSAESAGAPSGTAFHSAAKTPVLTITDGADFTALGAFQATITLLWYEATAS